MPHELHSMQQPVKGKVARHNNDHEGASAINLRMAKLHRLPTSEPYGFRHFMGEWAERAELRQVDLAEITGADKSVVSRWFAGMRPKDEYLALIAKAVKAPEIASLFRHPDDDWIARYMRDRTEDERRRMIQMLEAAFPPKTA
jgi:hypothetical protein